MVSLGHVRSCLLHGNVILDMENIGMLGNILDELRLAIAEKFQRAFEKWVTEAGIRHPISSPVTTAELVGSVVLGLESLRCQERLGPIL